jgi:hypothetical protein
MSSRLEVRLQRLEARHLFVEEERYTPLEPPPGWYEEVLRLLWTYGYLESVLRQTFELPEAEVTRLMEMAASDFAAFVAVFEETPPVAL